MLTGCGIGCAYCQTAPHRPYCLHPMIFRPLLHLFRKAWIDPFVRAPELPAAGIDLRIPAPLCSVRAKGRLLRDAWRLGGLVGAAGRRRCSISSEATGRCALTQPNPSAGWDGPDRRTRPRRRLHAVRGGLLAAVRGGHVVAGRWSRSRRSSRGSQSGYAGRRIAHVSRQTWASSRTYFAGRIVTKVWFGGAVTGDLMVSRCRLSGSS